MLQKMLCSQLQLQRCSRVRILDNSNIKQQSVILSQNIHVLSNLKQVFMKYNTMIPSSGPVGVWT